jgi:DeoR family ulaG and ulaABCDEF operon transcriptional repressor
VHATERENAILAILKDRGFVSFRDLETSLDASPATLRRDLNRMAEGRIIERVHGGAKLLLKARDGGAANQLTGVPFHENVEKRKKQKQAIGRAAAKLCLPGEAIMIDGGSTTLQMCSHLNGLSLQVLTNSLHIVNALLPEADIRLSVPGGAIFREQDIILSASGDDLMPRFHAPKLFMGCAALGPSGVMQADVVLVAAERRLIERAEEVILLADSSKFTHSSGNVVCGLQEINKVVTDAEITDQHRKMLVDAGVDLIIA